jgi:hypothetical protein
MKFVNQTITLLLLIALVTPAYAISECREEICCDLGYHTSAVKLVFFDEYENRIINETVSLTPVEYDPYPHELLFLMFGIGYHPQIAKQKQFITDSKGTISTYIDRRYQYEIECRNYTLRAVLSEEEYTIGIPDNLGANKE